MIYNLNTQLLQLIKRMGVVHNKKDKVLNPTKQLSK